MTVHDEQGRECNDNNSTNGKMNLNCCTQQMEK